MQRKKKLDTYRKRRLAKRHAMRRWRAKNPIMASWHAHLWNAKKRKIAVAWTYSEFVQFCLTTNYHELKKKGYQIHREGDTGPYRLDRCTCVEQIVNLRMEAVYRKINAWQERHKVLSRYA